MQVLDWHITIHLFPNQTGVQDCICLPPLLAIAAKDDAKRLGAWKRYDRVALLTTVKHSTRQTRRYEIEDAVWRTGFSSTDLQERKEERKEIECRRRLLKIPSIEGIARVYFV